MASKVKLPIVTVNGVRQSIPHLPEIAIQGTSVSYQRQGRANVFSVVGGVLAAGNDPTVFQLNQQINKGGAGYNSFPVTVAPIPALGNNMVWVFEPYTDKCEAVPVFLVGGTTVFMGGPTQDHSTPIVFNFDHALGSRVIVLISPQEQSPILFGAKGDGVTDDWLYVQRAAMAFGELYGSQSGTGIDQQYKLTKPLTVYDGSMLDEIAFKFDSADFDTNCLQSNLTGATVNGWPGESPRTNMMAVAESVNTFSVASPGTTMVVWGGNNHVGTGSAIRFTSLWSRTLPTGLIEGRIYRVKSVAAHANVNGMAAVTIDIAEVATPTVAINLGAGAGETYSGFASQIKQFMNQVTFISNVPNLDGPSPVSYNQPSRSRDTIINALAPTGNELAANLSGDLSSHTNMNIRLGRGGNKVGINIHNNANVYDSINISGLDPNDPTFLGNLNAIGMILSGKGEYVARYYCEGVGLGVDIGGNDSSTINMGVYKHVPGGIGFARVNGSGGGWQINTIQCSDLNVPLIVFPGGFTFSTWDGSQSSGVGDTDENGVFPGLYNTDSLGVSLRYRFSRSWKASDGIYKFRHIYEGLTYTSDANNEVWLSSPYVSGQTHWIYKTTGSNNLTVRDHTGAQIGSVIVASGLYNFLYTNQWVRY